MKCYLHSLRRLPSFERVLHATRMYRNNSRPDSIIQDWHKEGKPPRAYRSLCWVCYLPGKARMAVSSRILLDSFTDFLAMDMFSIASKIYFSLHDDE
jgi:PhoPQ-activated pathogenicity-related protein